jgi:hypothetical protein
MDPILGGIITNVLGGILGRKKKPGKYVIPPYAKIRAEAEAAGFNPLISHGAAGGGQVVEGGQSFGSVLAQAALSAADGLLGNALSTKAANAENENIGLKEKLQRQTLLPARGTVLIPRHEAVPTVRQSMVRVADAQAGNTRQNSGVPAANPTAVGGLYNLGGLSYGAIDVNERETVASPILSDAGYMVIDNPEIGRPFRVPASNGEVMDAGQVVTVGASKLYDDYQNPQAQRELQREMVSAAFELSPMPRASRIPFDAELYAQERRRQNTSGGYRSADWLPLDYYPFRRRRADQ